mmetsp:Transcript_140913/g.392779  ORF Transcript_140913/g.392779 Transcript_140913/m.392779 type:complete len:174 (-) Transcript_140913:45-566(-)
MSKDRSLKTPWSTATSLDRDACSTAGSLAKNSYTEVRPKLPCFTRHAEFRQGTRQPMHTEVVTWSLSLRPQTPAFSARQRPRGQSWNPYVSERGKSFDMLRDLQDAQQQEPLAGETGPKKATPRVHVDPHRPDRHDVEPYTNTELRKTNMQTCRFLVENRERNDVIQTMLALR